MNVPKNDLDKAIAAFRESIREGVVDWQVIRAGSNLLAALDAAQAPPAAVVPDAAELDLAIHLAALGDNAGAAKQLLAWAERAQGVGRE